MITKNMETSEIEKPNPLTDEGNRLVEIENAERACLIAEAEVEECKESLKFAKANYDRCVDFLRSLARANANDADRPLLLVDQPEVDRDAWKEEPISVLWREEIKGFGASMRP